MRYGLAALAFLASLMAISSAHAYRLCIRAGGFDSRHAPNVYLSVGATLFTARNGGYYNPGYAQIDTCFDTDAWGPAKVGWSSPTHLCVGTTVGAAIPEGHQSEVWFVVDAVVADPGLGGRMPTCQRIQ